MARLDRVWGDEVPTWLARPRAVNIEMAQLRSTNSDRALGSIAAIVFVYGLGQVLINLVILIFNLLRLPFALARLVSTRMALRNGR